MGWVKDRYACTLDLAFAELLYAVKADVEEANSLLPEHRKNTDKFVVSNGRKLRESFVVIGCPINRSPYLDKYRFLFELIDAQIHIERTGPDTLPKLEDMTITQKWDAATSSCLLFLDGKQVPVSEIRQVAVRAYVLRLLI